MDDDRFWQMIDWANDQSRGDMEKKYWCLHVQILQLSPTEATVFSEIYDRHLDRSFTHQMAEAGDILVNGIGDDGFDDFRAAVLSMGKRVYERALNNPDTLVESNADIKTWQYESFTYAVRQGVEQVTGSFLSRRVPAPRELGGTPYGGPIEERFPRLFWWAKRRHNDWE